MNDTCEFEKCYFFQLLDNVKQCPNYQEIQWRNEKNEFHTTKDCAPKRTTLMIQGILTRIIALQKTDEESRNMNRDMVNVFSKIIKTIQDNPEVNLKIELNDAPGLPRE